MPIYSFGVHEGEIGYFAMRLMRGGSLADLLRNGPLPPALVVEVGTQIGRALSYAHSRGIIHRDLKLSNILLDEQGNAFLADFGLAKLLTAAETQPTDKIRGSVAYISPEQVQGKPATIQSDIYGLGMVFYELLTGRPAFEGSAMSISYKHVQEQPIPPHEVNPNVPVALGEAVMQALEKDPQARYACVDDLVEALNTALGRKYNTDSFRVISSRSTRRPQPRLPRALLAVLALLVVVIGSLVWLVNRPSPPTINILMGETATLDELVLTEEELAAARRWLGAAGFIAYISCSHGTVDRIARAREMKDFAEAHNLPFLAYNSGGNAAVQPELVAQARADGAQAFILCILDMREMTETVEGLADANYPLAFVVAHDMPYGIKLGTDSFGAGFEMGEFAAGSRLAHQQPINSAAIMTYRALEASREFADGAQSGLRAVAPAIDTIQQVQADTLDDVASAVQTMIDGRRLPDVIICMSDACAFAIIEVLEAAGIPNDQVTIVSAGGDPGAQAMAENGHYLRGTLTINRSRGSELLFKGVVKLLASSPVPEFLLQPPGDMLPTQETLQPVSSP